jgi:hypothetical protein
MLILLYLIVTIILCVILYRELEINTYKRENQKYRFYINEDEEYLLFIGRILWPISIPIYLIYLLMEFFIKRLYKFISKFIN